MSRGLVATFTLTDLICLMFRYQAYPRAEIYSACVIR